MNESINFAKANILGVCDNGKNRRIGITLNSHTL